MEKIKIVRHTEGDSRVSKEVPSFSDFQRANESHVSDVIRLAIRFCAMLRDQVERHDWTKREDPYKSMFYRDLCNTIDGKMDFFDGKWSKLHYDELERHHLKRHCPDDVNMLDVIEMICDCVAAGMARSGEVYDLDIDMSILTKAINNTVELLKNQIELVDEP